MKKGIILGFLVIAAIFSAGCTGSNETIHPAEVQPTIPGDVPAPAGTTATVSPAATHISAVTMTSSPALSKTVHLFGEYKWADYRNNITQTLPPNPR